MKCRKCGADLLDTDTFCVKCGQRVDGPMFCSNCGEQLRDGERFCHKCGAPVEGVPEDDEIPLSRQRTVDIPFDQIEQGILLEAKQAIVKRPQDKKPERRNPEDYRRPGSEESAEYGKNQESDFDGYRKQEAGRGEPYREAEDYRPRRQREAGYYEESNEDDGERYERSRRRTPPRPRYEEEYDEEEDSDDSKMKVVTVILGIAVVAIGLVIGFIFWQRSRTPDFGGPGETTGQGDDADGAEDGEGGAGASASADVQGRIQILSNVNVRNKPTTEDSEVLMVAKTGETYDYYELVDDAWYHIKLEDGREGYVSKNYVEDLQ